MPDNAFTSNALSVPLGLPVTEHHCPAMDCRWSIRDDDVSLDEIGLSPFDILPPGTVEIVPPESYIDAYVRAALLGHRQELERRISAHVDEHPVEDWLRTIHHLRRRLKEPGYRPVVDVELPPLANG